MNFDKNADIILKELETSLHKIEGDEINKALELIKNCNKIFVLGLGRAGFMAKSFAMRMMHMGREAYVVGETITPNFSENDLLIITSGSGETKEFLQKAEKAKSFGGKVLAITANKESTLAKISDAVITINAASKGITKASSIQPMASLYEQSILLLCDSLVLCLMDLSNKPNSEMFKKHSNLE